MASKRFLILVFALCAGIALVSGAMGALLVLQPGQAEISTIRRTYRLIVESNADRVAAEIEGYSSQTANIFEVKQFDDDVVFSVDNSGNAVMAGAMTVSGTQTYVNDLNMANNEILNIGVAGTDFQDNGGLTLAQTLTVTAGGANVTGGLAADYVTATGNVSAGNVYVGATQWNSGSKVDGTKVANADLGDVGVSSGVWAVEDDSHAHTSSTLSGVDISSDTNLTAGDGLTLTDDDLDFDGGATPGGSLGGTWGSPTIDDLFVLNTGDTVAGDLSITGYVSATGFIDLGTFLNLTPQTAITITDGGVITPTGSYQPLQVSNAVNEITPTISTAGFNAGDVLMLTVETTPTINIVDSGTAILEGAWAGGQYDTLLIWFDGTNWREIGRSNN